MKKTARELERFRKTALSAERGASLKKSAPIRVCLIFPNTYYAGMSNLAVHTLYSILNSREDCICERSFCEEPLIGRSLETGSRLDSFHILAFTISFELDYPNIPRALSSSKIPIRSADRDESHPLVIAGGPCCFSNPEPIADFIDLFAIGEGEEIIHEIIDAFTKEQNQNAARAAMLDTFADIDGVYVPSLYEPVYSNNGEFSDMKRKGAADLPIRGRIISSLDDHPCHSTVVTPKTEFADMFLVELGRGCRRKCKFCSASHIYLRRDRSLDSIKEQVNSAQGLADRIGLVTSDLADYPDRKKLLTFLLNMGLGFSVSSVRADAITDDLLAGLKASGQKTLTLAPETATKKLAALTGKKISAASLLAAVESALSHEIPNFRLYFMIGLPGEEEKDIEAIIKLATEVHKIMRGKAKSLQKMGKLTISVNPFIPKPFTPLEQAAFADSAILAERVKILKKGMAVLGNTRLLTESPRMARLQCIFARGDRRVARLVEMIAKGRTASQSFRAFGKEAETYLTNRSEDSQANPWDCIEPPGFVGPQ